MQSNLDVRWKLNDKGRALLKSNCSNIYDHKDQALNEAPINSSPEASGVSTLISTSSKNNGPITADKPTVVAKEQTIPAPSTADTPENAINTIAENTSVNTPQETTPVPATTVAKFDAQIANSSGITAPARASALQTSNQNTAANTVTGSTPPTEQSPATTINESVPFNDIPLPDDEFYQEIDTSESMTVVPPMAQGTVAQVQNSVQRVSQNEESRPRLNWHLRKKRADIYIEEDENIPYLAGLKSFLTSKGITLLAFDTNLHYLPYDLILLRKAHYQHEGQCAFLDDGKAAIWSFLQQHLKKRL